LSHTILKQNYFKFQNNFYIQKTGLAYGVPTSSVFSEIYLQLAEHTVIYDTLVQNNILGYFRYVDDILIAYNASVTSIYKVFNSFNNLLPKMKFTMENEVDNQINFLDITIIKEIGNLALNIYRKPTTTDIIIPGESCHPQEQKHMAIIFLTNRMNTYYVSDKNRQVENNTIEHILHNNNYKTSILNQFNKTKQKEKQEKERNKWAEFTYIGKETKFVMKLFKNSSIKVSFTTNNTVSKALLLKSNQNLEQNKYGKSGIYRLTCLDCNMRYVGQTGRPFRIHFKEHFQDYKYANKKSKFAKRLLENGHSFGHIENIMEILDSTGKGKQMDTLENFYIFKVHVTIIRSMTGTL
jgi:hypothetical protein